MKINGLWQAILLVIVLFVAGCSSSVSTTNFDIHQKILKSRFPSITGKRLTKEVVSIPKIFKKKPAVLLIGFKQNAQFDIDRWMYGLLASGSKTQFYELPTISGLVPRVISGYIDNGMRSGIPKEDWANVITIYKDASKVEEFLGGVTNEQNAQVVLLDSSSEVSWFYNRGYSAGKLIELLKLIK